MIKRIFVIFSVFILIINNSNAEENIMILKLKDGDVEIELFKDIAPNHVERFTKLANEKKYDGVVFHRVIDGFMAQTGDVQFGNSSTENYDLKQVGTGGSEYPDLKSEFSDLPHVRGTLSMARSQDPNSANSQFFICFKDSAFLDRQYTVFGKVIKGMEFVDLIKRGAGSNGEVSEPDKIISLSVK
tara:strand:+ start:3559 stop:4116 length:558 start_codon:yes stop_codon:yes gene_type:complete